MEHSTCSKYREAYGEGRERRERKLMWAAHPEKKLYTPFLFPEQSNYALSNDGNGQLEA